MKFASLTVVRSVVSGFVLLLTGLLFARFVSSTPAAATQRADKINLALRRTADHLLRATGDSTSQIPPVQQVDASTVEVRLDRAFNYDQLPDLLHQSLKNHGIAEAYDVTVLDCAHRQLQLGYTVSDLLGNRTVPCEGRAMKPGCYLLRVTFASPPAQPLKADWPLALLSLVVGLLYVVWRRSGRAAAPGPEPAVAEREPVRFGNSSFNVSQQSLTTGLQQHKLTYREAKLLRLLVSHANQVLERDAILKAVWEDEGITVGRSVDVFVSRLRKLLQDDPAVRIAAVHGVGYRLEIDESRRT